MYLKQRPRREEVNTDPAKISSPTVSNGQNQRQTNREAKDVHNTTASGTYAKYREHCTRRQQRTRSTQVNTGETIKQVLIKLKKTEIIPSIFSNKME